MRWKIGTIVILFLFVCKGFCFKIANEEDNVLEEHSNLTVKFQQNDETGEEDLVQEENIILTPDEARSEGVILEDLGDGVKIVEDLSLFDEINSKHPRDGDDIVGEFEPINVPTDFQSYDVNPKDGFIQLKEIIEGTGAEENAKEAFEDADINRDGLLSWDEFHNGPWNLDAEDEINDIDKFSIDVDKDGTESEFEFD